MQLRSSLDHQEQPLKKDSEPDFRSTLLLDVDALTQASSKLSLKVTTPRTRALKALQKSAKKENSHCEYIESAEQLKTRLRSHLLTGRVRNKSLLTFAKEVQRTCYV